LDVVALRHSTHRVAFRSDEYNALGGLQKEMQGMEGETDQGETFEKCSFLPAQLNLFSGMIRVRMEKIKFGQHYS
jgi:hypothetical protein